jgi:uncharacterized lipoprotein YmbA
MITFRRLFLACVVCAGGLFLTGCLNLKPEPDATRFYTLAVNGGSDSTERSGPVDLLVRDIELAEYLDNSKIVERIGPTELRYRPLHRWGGALDAMIADRVVEVLREARPEWRVSGAVSARSDRVLDLRILRFESTRDGEVVVSLEWTLRKLATDDLEGTFHTGQLTRSAPLSSPEVSEIVAQLSQLLREAVSDLARELE